MYLQIVNVLELILVSFDILARDPLFGGSGAFYVLWPLQCFISQINWI